MEKFLRSLTFMMVTCPGLLCAQNYPTETSKGDVVETYIAINNAFEIGLANATNARRAWLLSRHATTDVYGRFYSSLHLQPDIGNKTQYRGVAIGYNANSIIPIGTHLAVNGDVGIGTTEPSGRLHVIGDVRFQRQDSGGNNHLLIHSNSSGVYLTSDDPGTNQKNLYVRASPTGDGSTDRHIYLQAGKNASGSFLTRMIIRGNGNVGIGVTSPTQKLEVNGTVRAKEVKLEATNWPDYVFSENYQLPSLEETSAYIKAHGHLPGFKSAAEYETEGVNMLELNQKLLEKVEEMMLYLIIQDEKMQRTDRLETEIETLKQLIKDKL